MEIETQTISTYPLQPESNHNHPFPYSLPMGLTSSSELKDGRNSETAGTVSPDSADAAVSNHKTAALLEMPLHADSGLKEVDSDQQESDCAAVKLQKAYRGYRTRRKLADSAVVAEELWWQAIDYARLNHSTVSFFDFSKRETPASRWNRVSLNASKVGKGLSKDAKAQKLAFQHWIEAIDPRHRYGHSLHIYYEEWRKADAGQPFFYWLDLGDGKDLDLKECPRSKLRQQCIKYLGPKEREDYEYIVVEGKILHKQTGEFLHTMKGTEVVKWIFVMSPSNKLYAGQKKKGGFHHSSFLAGGVTEAAGRLVADHGVLKSISAYSGHYRPTDERLDSFLSFLTQNGVNLNEVEIHRASDVTDTYEDNSQVSGIEEAPDAEPPTEETEEKEAVTSSEQPEVTDPETKGTYQRTLSGGLQSPRADVPKKAILQRINSKKAVKSYQLGNQLSLKWSTGAGPRIGCVADYPAEVRQQALEFVNLSPRSPPTPSSRVWSNSPKTPRASQLYNGMGNHSSY